MNRILSLALILIFLVENPLMIQAQSFAQQTKIVAADRQASDYFGHSVSISGNYAIVGAPWESHDKTGTSNSTNSTNGFVGVAGAAYIYEKDNTGKWVQMEKLIANDRQGADWFGFSVSISGDYAIVGAYSENHDETGTSSSSASSNGYAEEAGAAYIFERNQFGNWIQKQKLVASDRQENDWFGRSVAISGNYAVVGAMYEAHDTTGTSTSTTASNGYAIESGAAYLFERDGLGNWNQIKKLTALDRQRNDYFGISVSISGNRILIGAQGESHNTSGTSSSTTSSHGYVGGAGSAYIFEKNSNGNWVQKQKFISSDRQATDKFGNAVSISGDYAIVGAVWEDHDNSGTAFAKNAGAAYIFERNTNGIWNEKQKITSADRQTEDYFGHAVCIDGPYAVVGAVTEDHDSSGTTSSSSNNNGYALDAGSAFVFKRNSNGIWSQTQKITSKDRQAGDNFGHAVSVSDSNIMVGAYYESHDTTGSSNSTNTSNGYARKSGAAYIFSPIVFPTSVEQLTNKGNAIRIYPNPTSGFIIMEIQRTINPNTEIQLFDIYGRKVSMKLNVISTNKIEADLSSLAQGVYLLHFKKEGAKSSSLQIVKK